MSVQGQAIIVLANGSQRGSRNGGQEEVGRNGVRDVGRGMIVARFDDLGEQADVVGVRLFARQPPIDSVDLANFLAVPPEPLTFAGSLSQKFARKSNFHREVQLPDLAPIGASVPPSVVRTKDFWFLSSLVQTLESPGERQQLVAESGQTGRDVRVTFCFSRILEKRSEILGGLDRVECKGSGSMSEHWL